VVLDGESGELLETLTTPNDSVIKSDQPWAQLQDPQRIIARIEQIVRELELKHAPAGCIGLTGQMHGILYLDKAGNAVSPLYTWQDGRGNLAYRDGLSYAEFLSQAAGYKLASGFGAVTHFYNLVNGLVPDSARSVCTIYDYAGMKLSRAARPVLHASSAASLGCFDIEAGDFDRGALQAAGLDETFFPQVTTEVEPVGNTATNIPVAVAIGDNQASFIGSVNHPEACLLVNIGTSGQISLFTSRYIKNSPIEIRPLSKEGFLMVGASLCGGRSYAMLENFFRAVVEMATGKPAPALYELMNEKASGFAALENKLEIATQFSGTRQQPWQRAVISNLGVDNFTPAHFIVGVLQGVAQELHDLYQSASAASSIRPQRLVGSGNALRLCVPLQKLVSEMFGMPLSIPRYKEEAACGAALFALVAADYQKSLADAQALLQYEVN
jgi:sedoheptulokinase